MRKFSIRNIFYAMLTTAVVLFLMDLFIYKEVKSFLLDQIREDLAERLSLAKTHLDFSAVLDKDRVELEKYTEQMKYLTGLRTTIIDKQGVVLADSDVPFSELPEVENHLNRKEIQEALRRDSGLAMRKSATINRDLIYYAETLRQRGRVVGFLRFAMFAPEFRRKMSFATHLIFWISIILFFMAVVLALLNINWVRRNLKMISAPLEKQREKAIFQTIPPHSYEEFDRIVSDINTIGSKLQEQNRQLFIQKEQILNIFNSMAEGVAAFDMQGYLVFRNMLFLQILQLEESETQERPFYEWLRFPPLIGDIEKYQAEKKPVKTRIKYYSDKYIEYQILPLRVNEDDRDEGFLVVVQDVTHLQKLERIRQDFVANVSHEFKTPLTSIRGYAETLLSGLADDGEVRERFLNKIMKQTVHLENLVGDLLQLSRIEKKEVDEIQRMNPLPVIRDIAEEFTSIAGSKGLTFTYKLTGGPEDIYIQANSNLIHTLLSNLISNSVQYSKPGGKIWLRTGISSGKMNLEVEDNGIGISEKEIDRIFERFYRTEASRTIYAEGSGLGLSIVKHIVGLLNGQMGAESKLGEGTTFRIEIPLD